MTPTLNFGDHPCNNCPCERPFELKSFPPTLCCRRPLRQADRMTWQRLAVVSVKRTIWWPNGTFAALTTYRYSQVILCSCQNNFQERTTASILAKCFRCQCTPVYSVMCNIVRPSCWIFLQFLISTGVSGFHFSFDSNFAIVFLFLWFSGS